MKLRRVNSKLLLRDILVQAEVQSNSDAIKSNLTLAV